jgi:hypothetical protein
MNDSVTTLLIDVPLAYGHINVTGSGNFSIMAYGMMETKRLCAQLNI